MINRCRTALIALAIAVPSSTYAQQTAFTTYVAVGDSLTAGVVNGTLVVSHQTESYPALLARQAGVTTFEQPTIAEPGNPPELQLTSLLPRPLIEPKASSAGAPTNLGLARPYNNLGIPTAIAPDLLTRTTDGGGPFDLVLRGLGTAVNQAKGLRPTFVTLWIGNNDVLGAVIRGRAVDGVTLTPAATFRAAINQIVAELRSTGAPVIAATLPDVTLIPFVTTIPAVVIDPSTGMPLLVNGNPVPLLGPNGPLASGSFVTLAASTLLAQGVGIPTSVGGQGTPLPDEVILDAAEIASIRDRVRVNNQAIREAAQANGATVLDLNAVFAEITAVNGRNVGGIEITAAFLTGGFFGYDGVHPTELGNALVANEWIAAVNATGAAVEPVNLGPFLGVSTLSSSSRRRSIGPELTLEAYERLLALYPRVDGR